MDLGVQESILKNIKNIESFAEKLTEKLKEKAQTEFGYQYKLENKEASHSIFHLFFVTKHIKGVEKFLEAKNKIREKIEKSSNQLSFLDSAKNEVENKLREILFKEITNHKLFKEIIKMGYLPNEINPILKELEGKEHLEVELHGEFIRRKHAYYLKWKHEKTITIRLMQ